MILLSRLKSINVRQYSTRILPVWGDVIVDGWEPTHGPRLTMAALEAAYRAMLDSPSNQIIATGMRSGKSWLTQRMMLDFMLRGESVLQATPTHLMRGFSVDSVIHDEMNITVDTEQPSFKPKARWEMEWLNYNPVIKVGGA